MAESPVETAFSSLRKGARIGEYRIVRCLGAGAMATVYEVERERDAARLALKLCNPSPDEGGQDIYRFRRECRNLARLKHPNLVAMLADGVYGDPQSLEGQRPYMVMELVEGTTLEEELGRLAAQPSAERHRRAVEVARGICDALAYVHRAGLVHRDLKPGNVMVTREGEVKLTDFGVAREINGSSRFTRAGALVGTLAYMAPEQAVGTRLDGRADLYSLGVILYEMLAGRRPFEAQEAIAMLYLHAREEPAPLRAVAPDVSPALAEVVMRLLAKRAEQRFASAAAVRQALDQAADLPRPGAGSDATAPHRQPRTRSIELRAAHVSGGVLLQAPLAGRQAQRAALRAAMDRALAGRPGWVAVHGEEGMGAAAFVEAVITDARVRHLRVLRGRCAARGALPYGAFASVMEQAAAELLLLADERSASAADLLRRMGPVLGSVFRGFAGPADEELHLLARGGDPKAEQRRVRAAIRQVLEQLAAPDGLLVVVEDRHLADPESEALLGALAQHLLVADARVLLVTTERGGEVRPAVGPLQPAAVKLGPISLTAVGELVSGMLGTAVPPGDVERVYALARGAPELVEETLRYLHKQGRLGVDGFDWTGVELPDSGSELQRARRAHFSDAAERVLEAAAVIAIPWRFEVLRDMLRAVDDGRALPEDLMLDGINELLREGALVEVEAEGPAARGDEKVPARYAMSHGGLAESVYAEIPPRRRIALHGAAGQALARWTGGRRGRHVLVIAEHLDEGGIAAEAAPFYLSAAERWAQLGMTRARAVGCLERVEQLLLASPNGATQELRVRALNVRALMHLRMEELGDADAAAAAYRDVTLGAMAEGGGPSDPAERARHEGRWRYVAASVAALQAHNDAAREHFEATVEAARQLGAGDDEGAVLLAEGLLGRAWLELRTGRFEEGRAQLAEVLASRGAELSPHVRVRALTGQAIEAYFRTDLAAARALALEAGALAEGVGATDRAVAAQVIAASADTLQARFSDALEEAREALGLALSHDERYRFLEAAQCLADIHLDAGQITEAAAVIGEDGRYADRLRGASEFPPVHVLIQMVRARLAVAEGRLPAAIGLLEDALHILEQAQLAGHRPLLLARLARAQGAAHSPSARQTARSALSAASSASPNIQGLVEAHLAAAAVALVDAAPQSAAPHATRAWQYASSAGLHAHAVRAAALAAEAAEAQRDAATATTWRTRGARLADRILAGLDAHAQSSWRGRPEVQLLLCAH